jgi:AraC-like DNA-binding protein
MPAESQRIGCLGIQVRSYVYENLIKSNEAPSLENAAEYVGLTSYTLHRRLKREGLSYKDLLAMARQQMAFILLREENTSIEDISTKLGYLEVSSFTRAFKSWTNKTPLSYRNDLFRCK